MFRLGAAIDFYVGPSPNATEHIGEWRWKQGVVAKFESGSVYVQLKIDRNNAVFDATSFTLRFSHFMDRGER